MNVNSTNFYSNSASSNKGIAGLASGLDTEGMVESMLSGTQSKIDKQEALKQQTLWKQEIYRDLISEIDSFYQQFFKAGTGTNLCTTDLFNTMSSICSSSAIKATAGTSALTGKMQMQIAQLASAAQVKSGSGATGVMKAKLDPNMFEQTVSFDIADSNGTVLKHINNIDLSGATSNEDLVDRLNNDADFKQYAKASIDSNGRITIDGGSNQVSISKNSSTLGTKMLGFTGTSSTSEDKNGKQVMTGKPIDRDASISIDVTLDGIKKTIELEPNFNNINATDADGIKKEKQQRFAQALQESLDKEFGKDAVMLARDDSLPDGQKFIFGDGGSINIKTKVAGRRVSVGGDTGAIGLKSGDTNKINFASKLKDMNFATGLQGDVFKFKINDEEFTFSAEDTISDVLNKINSSDAGVKISYSAFEDKFTLESTTSGEGFEVKLEQTSGNLLTAMFGKITNEDGTAVNNSAYGKQLVKNSITGGAAPTFQNFKGGSMILNVNGKDVKIQLDDKKEYTSYDEVAKDVNKQLKSYFGKDDSGNQNISLAYNSTDNKFTLNVNNGAKVSINTDNENLATWLGFQENQEYNNNVDANTKLSELGVTNSAYANTTIGDYITSFNNANSDIKISFHGGVLTATNTDAGNADKTWNTGANSELDSLLEIFGTSSVSIAGSNTTLTGAESTKGQNAQFYVNGIYTERSTNAFTINGVAFELNETTGGIKTDSSGYFVDKNGNIVTDASQAAFDGDTIDINTSRDTDKIVDALKGFVDTYNKLIDKLNKIIDEDPDYKDYAPLTSAQKKEMTDREIELWEEKSKTGLLRKDNAISNFLSEMRTVLYKKPEDSDYALYNLGIDTSNDWRDKGKLVFDSKGEATLRQMLDADASGVQNFFNKMAKDLSGSIEKAARTTSGSPGTLVEMAGIKGKATEKDNTLSDRLKDIEEKIETLKDRYDMEKARYWKQFNAMESMISQMNSQSAWLSQQLGG